MATYIDDNKVKFILNGVVHRLRATGIDQVISMQDNTIAANDSAELQLNHNEQASEE